MRTTQCDFVKYQRLKKKVEKEIATTMNSERYTELRKLYRQCFPTKEQVIEEITAFFNAEEGD